MTRVSSGRMTTSNNGRRSLVEKTPCTNKFACVCDMRHPKTPLTGLYVSPPGAPVLPHGAKKDTATRLGFFSSGSPA